MAYYNTTNENGKTLFVSENKAVRQEKKILAYFREHPVRLFTPSQIWSTCFDLTGYRDPLTSIRRGITNLTTEGKLIKTKKKKFNVKTGRPEYLWGINKTNN